MHSSQFRQIFNFLRRNKLSSIVNILSLSVGFTVFILLSAYTTYESNFDRTYDDGEQLYRLGIKSIPPDGEPWIGITFPAPLKAQIESSIPEIESVSRYYRSQEEIFQYKEIFFEEKQAYYADQDLVDILNLEFVSQKQDMPLAAASSVVIDESTAKRYFGQDDPLGKVIELNWGNLEVTGVYKNLPKNTSLHPEMLISFDSPWWLKVHYEERWDLFFLGYYMKVAPNSNPDIIAQKVEQIFQQYAPPDEMDSVEKISLQSIANIHLGGFLVGEEGTGNQTLINIFKGIALLILLIGLVNYINLSSAQILERSSQVSIQKVLGIKRIGIIKGFTIETAVFILLAVTVALLTCYLLFPALNVLLDSNLGFSVFANSSVTVFILIVLASIGISVIYPVIIMSTMSPIECLKGKFLPLAGSARFRKGLIVFQFIISFTLIFGTMVFYNQGRLLINNDIGIRTKNILVLETNHTEWNSFPAKKQLFKNEMEANPIVQSITSSNAIPGFGSYIDWIISTVNGEENISYFSIYDTDYDFIQTMGLELHAGRELSREYGADSSSAVISLKGVENLGFTSPEDALGKMVVRDFTKRKLKVVGVVNDFKVSNLLATPYPPILCVNENQNRFLAIHYNNADETKIVSLAEEKWENAFDDLPFRYFFLDDDYRAVYASEVNQAKIITYFSLIAVILAALGLFGITYFIVVKREKEFSIRKVNGAIIQNIFFTVAKSFIFLMLLASLVAMPIAIWLSSQWLSNYRTRISIAWWYGFIPLLVLGLITLLTISYQTIKTARTNPATLLRSE